MPRWPIWASPTRRRDCQSVGLDPDADLEQRGFQRLARRRMAASASLRRLRQQPHIHNDNAIDDATINRRRHDRVEQAHLLHLDDDIINNVGGTLGVIGTAPSLVSLDNTTVIGGTLFSQQGVVDNSLDTFSIQADANGASTTTFDGSANAVTVDANVGVFGGSQLELKGTIHLTDNDGSIGIGNTPPPGTPGGTGTGTLEIAGTVTLDGGSQLSLEATAVQPDLIAAHSGGGTLDNSDPIVGTARSGRATGLSHW